MWLLAGVAAAYTIFGGLKAVIYTDFIQSILLLVGGGTIAVLAIWHPNVGGISGLLERQPEKFHVFFEASHPELPWSGVLSGLMVLHLYYWGTNQFIVQRTLGAKTGWDARMGTITAGFFKLLIPFLCIVPGMAAALHPGHQPANRKRHGLCRADADSAAGRLRPGGHGDGRPGRRHPFDDRLDDELHGHAVHLRHLSQVRATPTPRRCG